MTSPSTRIWLSPPHMSGREQQYVNDAFATNWIAPIGPHLTAFEEELADEVGVKAAAGLSSGTAAIHLALKILGVTRGDIVLVSSFTFSASANPVVYEGAIPAFIESEGETWNLSPEYLLDAINTLLKQGKKPKALVLVHLYGMPAKLREIVDICEHHDIPIIEDAAEALGATYFGRKLGSFGKCGVLSFNGNKIITCSGGGALLSDDATIIEKAKFLATQARDQAPHYQHSEIGYNYRLSNVTAGIGRGQLEVLGERVEKRRNIFEYYRSRLSECDGLSFLEEPEGFVSNRWLSTMLVNPAQCNGKTREDIRLALGAENIEARPLWKPLHLQPIFAEYPYFGDGLSEELFDKGLCLPSGSSLSQSELERVCHIVLDTVSH